MEESRQTTVLFADVSGSTKLYETAGDAAALTAIGRCIERMRKAAESTGGRGRKKQHEGIMALFPVPDAAAAAPAAQVTALQAPRGAGSGPIRARGGRLSG